MLWIWNKKSLIQEHKKVWYNDCDEVVVGGGGGGGAAAANDDGLDKISCKGCDKRYNSTRSNITETLKNAGSSM